jgi:hypothetical protein
VLDSSTLETVAPITYDVVNDLRAREARFLWFCRIVVLPNCFCGSAEWSMEWMELLVVDGENEF